MKAYWIKSDNTIKETKTIHIADVILEPDWFGITQEYISEIYAKYNEPIGHEGKARSEIMRKLIQNGFIRCRFTPKIDLWTFECNILNKNVKELIWSFFNHSNIKTNKYSNVTINELKDNKDIQHKTTVSDIKQYTGLFESSKFNQILNLIRK